MRPAIPALPGQCGQAPQLVGVVKANGGGLSNPRAVGLVSCHLLSGSPSPIPSTLSAQGADFTSIFSSKCPASLEPFHSMAGMRGGPERFCVDHWRGGHSTLKC